MINPMTGLATTTTTTVAATSLYKSLLGSESVNLKAQVQNLEVKLVPVDQQPVNLKSFITKMH